MNLGPLHLIDRGKGPLILLLHGGSGSWTHWFHNIEPLAERMRVVAIDLPGFGMSPDVAKDLSFEQYVSCVISSVESLIPSDSTADLAGFSFGGALAGSVAAALSARVRRVSLIAPGGFGVPVGRRLKIRKMPSSDAPVDEVLAVVAHNLGQVMLHTPPQPDDPVVDLQLSNLLRARFDSRRVSLQMTLAQDIKRFGGPVQVIWGRQDQLAYPDIQSRANIIRAVSPLTKIEIIENAGHWVQYERPAEVNRLLMDFHLNSRDCGVMG